MNHSPIMLVRKAEDNLVIILIDFDTRDRENFMNRVHIIPFSSDHSNLETKELAKGNEVMVVTPDVNGFVCLQKLKILNFIFKDYVPAGTKLRFQRKINEALCLNEVPVLPNVLINGS